MQKIRLPIGVFDSGMGGLTVLRALRAKLPGESFIYLGDTARLPYGTKSTETVRQYATQMARILVERQIKALVVACNTASTAALSHLVQILPDIPVIGVIEPGAQAVVRATDNHRVMVLATETTVASKAYQTLIQAALPDVMIQARASSLLVALAEEGMVDNQIAESVLLHYLSERTDEDTILLGCTHFPVFKPLLKALLPKAVNVVDSAEATADVVEKTLKKSKLLNTKSSKGKVHYLVTDSVERFESIGEIFLSETLNHAAVELVDV
ncbi:MAG: glutamate racemase [Gammaproteobacteria bacterium]|nr:glutamate racemase [Gammaproteobacteria bacterium]